MTWRTRIPATMDEHREMGKCIAVAERAILDVLHFNVHYNKGECRRLELSYESLGKLRNRLEHTMIQENYSEPWDSLEGIYTFANDDAFHAEVKAVLDDMHDRLNAPPMP